MKFDLDKKSAVDITGEKVKKPGGFVLVCVHNSALLTEVVHAVAAVGSEVISVVDPRDIARHYSKAQAVIIDETTQPQTAVLPARDAVFVVHPEPGPPPVPASGVAQGQRPQSGVVNQAFVLPAQSRELLMELGAAINAQPRINQEAELVSHRRTRSYNDRARVIAVAGATGGAGASTLAASLARMLAARDGRSLLIDAVSESGGLDLLLGVEDEAGARWPDIAVDEGTLAPHDVVAALPSTPDGVAVLSAQRSNVAEYTQLDSRSVAGIINSMREWDASTVVDCHKDAIPDGVDICVCVVTAQVRPVAAATGILARLYARRIPTVVLVRHRDWSGLEPHDIETMTHADVVAEIGTIKGLAKACELTSLPTRLPRVLKQACTAILEEVESL